MEMRVLGWRCRNLRGGLRELDIDLETKTARWVLIQMPNGLGKTTTMALLRAAFSGESLPAETVMALRASDDVEDGSFEVRLSIDGKPFRIELRLDFKLGGFQYWTSRSEVRGGGLEEGRALPSSLKRLLTPDFTRLFVFDGELAKEIRTVGKDRARTAIRTLYGLDRLDHLSIQIERLVEAKQQKAAAVSTATERKGVNRWRRAYESATARESALSSELRQVRKARGAADAQIAALKKEIDSRIRQDDTLKTRKERLNEDGQSAERAVLEATNAAMAALRSPAKLHPKVATRLHNLGERLTKLKLPKTISVEFFRELADQKLCICGRPITPDIKGVIQARAEDYLAEDQVLVINKMKLALRESDAHAARFAAATAQLRTCVRALDENRAAQDQLELERVEAGDDELERLRGEATKQERAIEDADVRIELLTTKDAARQRALGASEENNIALCAAEAKRCKEKHATATDTLKFVTQADFMRDMIARISESALEMLRERVRGSTNDKLARLAPSEALRVARISGSLELEARGHVRKTNVSEGQSLAVAYAFLTSLLSEAPCRLPFIVDSPAVSLDTAVRREVGDLIPDLFDQMIVFVISSEREGFADAFYARRGVRYVTVSRGKAGRTEVREGTQAFRSFHQEGAAT